MTALFFLPTLDGGGAEMNAVRIATNLRSNGIAPMFAVCRGPGTYAKYLPDDIPVHILGPGRSGSSTLQLVRSIRPLAGLIQQLHPDLVVPVMLSSTLAALAAVGGNRQRPVVVASIQNIIDRKEKGATGLVTRAEAFLARRTLGRADRVIALSHGVARDVAAAVPALEGRIEVVHNVGLPLPQQIAVPESGVTPRVPGRVRFLACGRLVEQKGYPYLLEAFARVASERDCELHILGKGPLEDRLRFQAEGLGVAGRVHFLGFRANPYLHMREADIFVLSSLWEGFGNVIVEAMSMGTPVIATRCRHGPDEIVCDGKNGLLVPPADAGALAEAMLRLSRDEPLRARLAVAGQARAGDFSVECIARDFAAVLHSAARNRQSP